MAQREVLDQVRSDGLAVYVVWEPILGSDREDAARRATKLVPDRRARHYWTNELGVGEAFQNAIPLVDETAWDVYLLYPPGTEWTQAGAPAPSYYMHQLGGRLPRARLLNGRTLAAKAADELRAAARPNP